MPGIPPEIAGYPGQPLPMIKAYADPRGLVSLLNHAGPTARAVAAGTRVLGRVVATLRGRSPLSRVAAFFAHQDSALLVGQAFPPQALPDATVGRVRARLYDCGTMRLLTACAVRASRRLGLERRSVPCETTSRRVWGESQVAETQALPFQVPYGSSQEKRPALKPLVLSTLGVERAVPLWGQPADGHASDQTLHTALLSEIAPLLASPGVAPGASISMADAALVTADTLAARGAPLVLTRCPAPDRAWERGLEGASARHPWEEGGVVAQTPPPKPRPGPCSTVAESRVPCQGQSDRAGVVHSSSPDQRRHKALARERQASSTALDATLREAAPQADCCRADAEAAAAQRRAHQSAQHRVAVRVEEPPTQGPGRPSQKPPRGVQAWRDGLKATRHERAEGIARTGQELGCFVLLSTVPTAGERAQRAGDGRRAEQEQHGVEQHCALLQDPSMGKRLVLKQPERLAALGVVFVVALLLGRLGERAHRLHGETTGSTLPGWDKQATQQPTACMMRTTVAAVLVLNVGGPRQLAPPWAPVPPAYLNARGVPATSLTLAPSG